MASPVMEGGELGRRKPVTPFLFPIKKPPCRRLIYSDNLSTISIYFENPADIGSFIFGVLHFAS
jgi:hypothetical protein